MSAPGPQEPEQPPPDASVGLPPELQEAQRKAQEYFDQLLRLRAEFENFRKRADREKQDLVRWGKEQILMRLLPLYDVLLKAHQQIQSKPEEGPLRASGAVEFARGLEMIFKEFERLLQSEGIFPIETVGRPLDPHQHEVLGAVERPDIPEGTVVEELQKGFLIEGRVLRPARVRIAQNRKAEEKET